MEKQKSPATIKDVAKAAGVSICTASRVVNHKPGVSENVTARVRQAIDTLKYRPNVVARALKARATKSIGLIIPSIENPVFPPLVKVIEDTANRYGFSTILCNSDGEIEKEGKYLELLIEKQVDGIILNAIGAYHPKLEAVKETNTPIVVIGRKIEGFQTTNVTVNNFKGAYMAVEYLIQSGMREIAFLFGQLESNSAIHDRFDGYKKALKDHGIRYKKELMVKGSRSFSGGVDAVKELLARKISFDSIFASNDIMAVGCMEELSSHGFKVPEDISVIGYDDISSAHFIKPRLSTVLNPPDIFGKEAVKAILRLIYSKKDMQIEKVFEPQLIIRESTKTSS